MAVGLADRWPARGGEVRAMILPDTLGRFKVISLREWWEPCWPGEGAVQLLLSLKDESGTPYFIGRRVSAKEIDLAGFDLLGLVRERMFEQARRYRG